MQKTTQVVFNVVSRGRTIPVSNEISASKFWLAVGEEKVPGTRQRAVVSVDGVEVGTYERVKFCSGQWLPWIDSTSLDHKVASLRSVARFWTD